MVPVAVRFEAMTQILCPIPRGDTIIFNKNFFDRKFFKTGPRCAEGSIW